jgi:hypothetical protein
MDYMLKRWEALSRFLDDGRICLTNNAASRSAARRGCSPAATVAANVPRQCIR